jgi:hypothetical protein
MKPNPTCYDSFWLKMQKKVENKEKELIIYKPKVVEVEEEVIIENPFEIEMCDDDDEEIQPSTNPPPLESSKESSVQKTSEVSLEDLMSQLGKL